MWDARRVSAGVALVSAAGAVWLVATQATGGEDSLSSPLPGGSPVGPEARQAASARQEVPGQPDVGVPPGFDFSRPEVVARAYLVAAHTVSSTDRGTTNRHVLPYLAPDNPAHPRGLVVVAAPPSGQTSTVTVDRLRAVRSDQAGQQIVYEAQLSTSTSGPAPPQQQVRFVVLAQQPDGRWLVSQESARLQPGD